MKEYHKIQTVYLRNPENKYKTLLEGKFANPEYEYLKNNRWEWTEKVDGTNIRIMYKHEQKELVFGGKTDNASIPAYLVNKLNQMFFLEKFSEIFDCDMCLYGEGYGAKIQKVGGKYKETQDFVLFDVKIGNWWLKRKSVNKISERLGIKVVPVIGIGTLEEMVLLAKNGFTSSWGNFPAEGIVARPEVDLLDRGGKRIITKIKTKDFK